MAASGASAVDEQPAPGVAAVPVNEQDALLDDLADLFPEVWLGRIPVTTPAHPQNRMPYRHGF